MTAAYGVQTDNGFCQSGFPAAHVLMHLLTDVRRRVWFDWAIQDCATIAASIGLTNNAIVSQRSNFVWCVAMGLQDGIGMLSQNR